LLAKDPPEHSRPRKLVAGAFTGKRTQALRPQVTRIADGLTDEMLAEPRPTDLAHSFRSCRPPGIRILAFRPGPLRDRPIRHREHHDSHAI
jgi:cytochrome P450